MADAALTAFHAALLIDDPRGLYDRAPCGYLSTLPDGTIVKVNETLLTWTGYDHDDLVGAKRFAEMLTPGGRIYHETHYDPMLRLHGSVHEIALDIIRADGSRLPALINSVVENDASGNPIVIRTAVFDATHRREYERELVRAKERAEASEGLARRLAETLQQTLIPPAPPEIPGLDVAAAYRPAGTGHEVGGDFYDIFQVAVDDWMIVVGDVCGKGIDAAVVTSVAKYTIRGAAVQYPDPAAVLRVVNEVLIQHESTRFCTLALARLRRQADNWHATISVGGHPAPIHLRPEASPQPVQSSGSLVGILPDPTYTDTEVNLQPGDSLVFFTDGVTEARNDGGDFYGDDRLLSLLGEFANESALEVTSEILTTILDFQNGFPRDDVVIATARCPT